MGITDAQGDLRPADASHPALAALRQLPMLR
jgi:hypothetical protein